MSVQYGPYMSDSLVEILDTMAIEIRRADTDSWTRDELCEIYDAAFRVARKEHKITI